MGYAARRPVATVETLRERIGTHRSPLSQSEALTRYALIDPLLRELGWDTSDPEMVVPEYRSGSGSADYALIGNGSPAIMVEAKKLGTPLRDAVLAQGINYCLMERTNRFAVTDGARWEIYETHKPVPIDQKRVAEFDLNGPSPAAEVCLKALALWRPGVQSGQVAATSGPVLTSSNESGTETESTTIVPPASGNEGEWIPIPDLAPEGGATPPREIMFPDGSRVSIAHWIGIPCETVRWLMDKNILTADHCPIRLPNSQSRYLLATSPRHSDEREMTANEVNGLYLNSSYDASEKVKNARFIIRHVGQDPAQFEVRFD